ncbi:MAG: aldo/keto reductase [Coriobacteriales bacterium]|jgi:predicted aldo/keto reductase-like oxidoreductase|nr:aldo/keto reductase [Coriobacteriales bacterium]
MDVANKPYLGADIPKLGFGLMRLPRLHDPELQESASSAPAGDQIDLRQTAQMVDEFLEAGFSYFDTAYGYPGSELAIAKALVARYPREDYLLASKLPAWAGAKTAAEAEAMLTTSLERTGAGYFDFYLLHNLGQGRTKAFDDFGIWDFVQAQKRAGLIHHVGFSIHDGPEALEDLLKAHPEIEFVQLQINYADWDNPAQEARRKYEVARRYGKPVVVMEPVKGGNLVTLPTHIADLLRKANPGASLASWAVRFAASLEGVVTVLSGMSDLDQLRDNISYMRDFRPLSQAEHKTLEAVVDALKQLDLVDCTNCGYCLASCQQNINIPGIFEVLNMYLQFGNLDFAKGQYGWNTKVLGKAGAGACIACAKCEAVCTQALPIIERLKQARQLFED